MSIYAHSHTHTHTHAHIHMHIHAHTHTHIQTYKHTRTHVHAHTNTLILSLSHTHTHTFKHSHTRTHTLGAMRISSFVWNVLRHCTDLGDVGRAATAREKDRRSLIGARKPERQEGMIGGHKLPQRLLARRLRRRGKIHCAPEGIRRVCDTQEMNAKLSPSVNVSKYTCNTARRTRFCYLCVCKKRHLAQAQSCSWQVCVEKLTMKTLQNFPCWRDSPAFQSILWDDPKLHFCDSLQ